MVLILTPISYCVGSKAKGRISKRVFQENEERQIFRKTNISYPHVRVRISEKEMFVFRKSGELCFLQTHVIRSPICLITDDLDFFSEKVE